MRIRLLAIVAFAALVAVLATGCGGGSGGGGDEAPPAETGAAGETQGGEAPAGEIKKGGILRIGTIDYIDSFNPYNYIEAQATNAFIMLYPQLVQYGLKEDGEGIEIVGDWASSWETSADGKDWTFELIPGAQWSDGTPMTAEDAAWTINTTVKYADGPTAVQAPGLAHVIDAEATSDTTLVIHYEQPVGNTLEQLEQFFILPRHVWEPLVGTDGKGLKTFKPEQNMPIVSGGAFTLKEYERKGTTVFLADPNYYGTPANVEAVTLTYFTNADSMAVGAPRRESRLGRPGSLQRGRRPQGGREPGRAGGTGRRDDQHHLELESAQAAEPRAPRPAGEEGAVDVRRPRAHHRGGLQRLRDARREPRRPHHG